MFFSAGGAIVVEWNVHDPAGQQGAAGMWDSHIRFVFPIQFDSMSMSDTSIPGWAQASSRQCKIICGYVT